MRAVELEGANRIGTAMWKSSIPAKYRQYPLIGQGATSVVLDKGDGTVLMLTRDAMKKDWLVQDWGLGLGEWVDSFDAPHQKSRDLSELPVFVIQLPRLYPLSAANKQAIKKAIKQYENVIGYFYNGEIHNKFNTYLEQHPDGLFARLVEFLQNYDSEQYGVDFLMRNFMQDAAGKIVLIDPIVSMDVLLPLQNIRRDIEKKRYYGE